MILKRNRLPSLFATLLALTAFGHAARADVSGLFFGVNGGKARIDTDYALYQRQQQDAAAEFGSLIFTKASLSNRRTAWWVETGYMVWPYVGIEASYLQLGKMNNEVAGTYTPTGGTAKDVRAATAIYSRGPALGFVFRLPLAENIDIHFRVADYFGRSMLTNTLIVATTTSSTVTKNSSSPLLGLGAAYTVGGHWSAKIDYTRIQGANIGTTDVKYNVDMLSAGVAYTF